ncbi:ABC transporter permease [Actinomadura algeriensis]|uniref:Peptide/nickel transport system permease protein n=1 Tax=Actinomadura algeriensis TaxID=1679523 RepID=A0ABR9K572_9ACTN|nr:ABC transporter permease [Actinomadura algeriensis]MBE1537823.1 peptide/nickel transport system permease protein [Actinomadura algeriensis]
MAVIALRRGAQLLFVLLAVTLLAFWMITLLPGDPATQILGYSGDQAALAAVRRDLGLDAPFWHRYLAWLGGVLTGDLGTSYISSTPVTESLIQRLPVTLELLLISQVISLGLAVPAGVAAARRAGGLLDRTLTTVSFGLLSTPVFVSGVALIMVFAVRWPLLPATGYTPFGADPAGNLRSMLLPAVTLAAGQLAVYARLLRSDLIATLQEDYITLARARGLSPRRILWRHALRPSAISLVTVVGLNLGALIGGAVIIETLFGLPGVGRLIVDSILSRDYLVVQGGVLLVAVGYVLVNFAIDLLYGLLDPRIRHAS